MHIVTRFISQHNAIASKHSTQYITVVTVPCITPLNDQSFSECFNHPPDYFVQYITYFWNDMF